MTPSIEVLVSDRGIVAYCRACHWLNGPFQTEQHAQRWGDRTHKTCDRGDLLAPLTGGSPPESITAADRNDPERAR